LENMLAVHYQELVNWCRRFVPPRLAEPEEIVHGAYLRSRRVYRPELGSNDRPLAYLQRSIRSELADRYRSEHRRRRRETEYFKVRRLWHEASPARLAVARESLQLMRGRPRDICLSLLAGKS